MKHFTLMWWALHQSGAFILPPMTRSLNSVTTLRPKCTSVHNCSKVDYSPCVWQPGALPETTEKSHQIFHTLQAALASGHLATSLAPGGKMPADGFWRCSLYRLVHLPLPLPSTSTLKFLHLRPTSVHSSWDSDSRYWQEAGSLFQWFPHRTRDWIKGTSHGSDFISHPHPCFLPRTHKRNIRVLYNTSFGGK